MVRAPDGVAARGDFIVGGQAAGVGVDRRLVEGIDRAQAGGVLAGVEIGVVGRAVQVHHVARVGCHQDGGAELAREIVQAFKMPVGIGHGACLGGQPVGHGGRQVGAHVRHRHQHRARAAMQGESGSIGREGHVFLFATLQRKGAVLSNADLKLVASSIRPHGAPGFSRTAGLRAQRQSACQRRPARRAYHAARACGPPCGLPLVSHAHGW